MLSAILAVAVVVAALVYVVRPFFHGAEHQAAAAGTGAREGLELVEERDRALAALKELEFDHRTGKVSDADYRELVGQLRRRAVEVLRSLEPEQTPTRSAPRRRAKGRARAGVGS
jgi:hypothetical protein